jgi:hypothetical protein
LPKPILFVGSSSEAKKLIRGLELNLEGEDVEVRSWGTSAWALSGGTLDGIEEKIDEADFAAFILSADDVATIRGERVKVARDNVLFELGLSFGRLDRDRTFILAPKDAIHTASDLAGITVVSYQPDSTPRKMMSTPASKLLEAIEEYGVKDRAGADGAVRRGSTATIDVVADGALEVSGSRNGYFGELRQAVLKGDQVPAKFQFAAADGGRHWLRLCRGSSYPYFNHAKELLKDNVGVLAEKIHGAAGTAPVDVISLGSGDGTKDEIILRELAKGLAGGEHLYYYPIDISDILLTEAVRYVSRHGLGREHYRCKAILGDFTNPSSLKEVIDYRPNTNLFLALGNVIGSFDESEILAGIRDAMGPGDLVLIEANIGKPADSIAMLEDDASNQWDLSTLAALDISPDSCELKQEMKTMHSVVPGTTTLVSYAVPRDDITTRYTLSAMHHYKFAKLKTHLKKDLQVSLVPPAISGKGVCLLLGQRST